MTAASGYGLLTLHGDTVLDVWFPSPVLGATEGDAPAELTALEGDDEARGVRREVRLVEIADLDDAPAAHRGRLAAAAPALHPPGAAARHVDGRRLRPAHQRRVDLRRAVRGRGLRGHPRPAARRRPARHRLRRRQVPAAGRLRPAQPASASPTPTGSASAPTWPRARRSCTRASSTSTPARSARRWSRAGSPPASSSATAPTSAAAPRSWAPCPAAARRSSRSASAACSAPTPASASRSATTASSRPAATSPPAPRSPSRDMDGKPAVVKAATLSGVDNILFRRNSVSGAIEAVPWKGDGHRPQRGTARQLGPPRAARCARPPSARWSRSAPSRPPWSWWTAAPCRPLLDSQRLHRRGRRPHRRGRPRAGRERRAHHGHRRRARHARPGGEHRARHGLPGVEALQHRLRRPGLRRAVPAAAVAGLGQRRAADRPRLRDQRLLRRARAGRRLRRRWRSPSPRRRCSARASPTPTPTTRRTPARSPPR